MRLFTFLVLLCCSLSALAQEPSKYELAPCGAPPVISQWLRDYTARPQDFAVDRSTDTLYVGLQIHLLAKDNGAGRFSPDKLLDAFCRLNADFEGARVRFYFKNEWHLIDSTGWYQHQTIQEGIDMMLANNVPGAQNSYFAANVANNCGYNLPYAGVAISHGCSGPNDHTWAHELGHALSLAHTFIGWEGKVYNSQNPTPDTLTYDYTYFHDSIETQIPAPLDTALVEYADGSNCTIAADLICDTKSDYLSYRWECDGQGNSLVQQKDPTGATFYSDGTLFMSYSFDHCSNRFSDEQIAVLRANLLTEKADWLTNDPPQGDITGSPELLAPIGGQVTPAANTVLRWTSVPNATRYFVQISRFPTFIVKEREIVTTDTTYVTGQLIANQNYYWRVRPFNDWFACTELTAYTNFKPTDITSATEPDSDGWRCYPTLLAAGQPLTLEMPGSWLNHAARYVVYNTAGYVVWENNSLPANTITQLQIPSENWPAGVYRVVVACGKGVKTFPLVITR